MTRMSSSPFLRGLQQLQQDLSYLATLFLCLTVFPMAYLAGKVLGWRRGDRTWYLMRFDSPLVRVMAVLYLLFAMGGALLRVVIWALER